MVSAPNLTKFVNMTVGVEAIKASEEKKGASTEKDWAKNRRK